MDFGAGQIQVRDGKGLEDRITVLPGALTEPLRAQMARMRSLPESDLKAGHGRVLLPGALRRKHPYADREPGWQWMFPPTRTSLDPLDGVSKRHHLLKSKPR